VVTAEQFEALVRRLEPEARANPTRYARVVALLAGLGYAFIALALASLVALAGVVVALAIAGPGILLKLLVPIGALAWVIVRSLAVKIEPPEGIRLRREDVPELFRMIDEVNAQVEGPKVHEVLVNGDLNAGVVQNPRLGGLFGHKNYLVIGLPYAQALSPEEFRAVIAHELGHLSKRHGRFGSWVYRVRVTWSQLLNALEARRSWATAVFRRFFEWYAPYFNAYTFPLIRAHEFEADEAAARAAGARPAATALVTAAVADRFLAHEYWPRIFDRVADHHEPPRTAFAPMRDELVTAKAHEDAQAWVEDELARPADVTDTHPSLEDRIRHLGFAPEDVVAAARSDGPGSRRTAAQAYLGDRETDLAEALDRDWHESVRPHWEARHQELREARHALADLEERARDDELPLDDARAHAQLTAELKGAEEAFPLFQRVLAREPGDPSSSFAVGQILLGRGDEAGLEHLDRAMEGDPDAVLPASESAYHFLKKRGRDEDAERYRRRGQGRYDELELAREERAAVATGGDFHPHELPDEAVEAVRAQLAERKDVKTAYLVRRTMGHLDDEWPLYVVFVVPRRKLWAPLGGERNKLVERIAAELELPFTFWVVSPSAFSTQPSRLRKIPGAGIYRR
jgi:Zn-dependent protease with chaperone function